MKKIRIRSLISFILIAAFTLQGVPTAFAAGNAQEKEVSSQTRSKKPSFSVVGDDDAVFHVTDGVAEEETVPGVSYDEDSAVLTLEDSKLHDINMFDGNATIKLLGENTLTGTGNLFLDENADTVVTGPGSLTMTIQNNAALYILADLTFTGGCQLTCHSDQFINGAGSVHFKGGTKLYAHGPTSDYNTMRADVTFEDCTADLGTMILHSETNETSPHICTYEIGKGADVKTNRMEFGDGSKLFINGGTLNVENDVDSDTMSVWVNNGSIEVADGNFNVITPKSPGIHFGDNNQYTQSGGHVYIHAGLETSAFHTYGIYVPGTDMLISGGTFEVLSGGNEFQGGTLTITGGTFTANNKPWGTHLCMGARMSVLGGEVSLAGADFGLLLGDGTASFTGGTTTLKSTETSWGTAVSTYKDVQNLITLGSGMYAVSDEEIIGTKPTGEGKNVYNVKETTISGKGGSYSSDIYVSSGRVIAGAPFAVKSAFKLEDSTGRVRYQFPNGMHYLEGSLTVNGKAVNDTDYYNEQKSTLTFNIYNNDIVRFDVYADKKGTYPITARVESGGNTHNEKTAVSASDYSLYIPAQTRRMKLPVSGTAVPGSKIQFYDNEEDAGSVNVNALGTWKSKIELQSERKSHEIYAVITHGTTNIKTKTPLYRLIYSPDMTEVKTLTIANKIHGARIDEIVECETVLNYIDGTRSSNYLTFWPDCPNLDFRVDFTDESDVDSVRSVNVVLTNKAGKEKRVPLTRAKDERYWMGTCQIDEENEDFIENYQVEWQTDDMPQSTEKEPSPDNDNNEKEKIKDEIDNSDGQMLIGENGKCTFKVSPDAKLHVLDGEGQEQEYKRDTDKNEITIQTDAPNGQMYMVELVKGRFPDYPDTSKLFVVMQGSGDGKTGSYQYAAGVREVSALPENAGDYKDGTVFVVNNRSAYTVVNGQYVDAALDEIFESLSVSQGDIPEQVLDTKEMQEKVERKVQSSPLYSSFISSVKTASAKVGAKSKEVIKPEVSSHINAETKKDNQGNTVLLFSFDIGIECEVDDMTFGIKLSVSNKRTLYMQVDYEKKKLKNNYFVFDETTEYKLTGDISFGEEEEEEEEDGEKTTIDLVKYFEDLVKENLLEEVKDAEEDEGEEVTLLELLVPCPPVPALSLVIELDFTCGSGVSGGLTLEGSVISRAKGGYMEVGGKRKKFYEELPGQFTGSATYHGSIGASIGLECHLGIAVFKCLEITFYLKPEIYAKAGGHVKLSISYPESEEEKKRRLKAECYLDVGIQASVGVRLLFRLTRSIEYKLNQEIWSKKFTLWDAGCRKMPTQFSVMDWTEENPLLVSQDGDLKNRIDMNLDYQQLDLGGYSKASDVFDLDKLKFKIHYFQST